jgi:YgiT-type zinc finger domain-containing protein
MSEECAFCQGDLEEKTITYPTEYEGRVVIVENVPALVCKQCGETLFRPDVAEKLQKIVWGEVPHPKPVQVDSYDFAEVA